MDRFLKYTKGREPVLSANVLAAILLGLFVKATEQAGLYTWDEFSLTAAGVIALAIATWIARSLAWAPASVERTVEIHSAQAMRQGFDEGFAQAAQPSLAPQVMRADGPIERHVSSTTNRTGGL